MIPICIGPNTLLNIGFNGNHVNLQITATTIVIAFVT